MEVTFTRISGDNCATEIVRADGVRWSLKSAGASRWLPHDLVHFVVEWELPLAQGFWDCIAAGADLGAMEHLSGRRKPHAKERSKSVLKSAGQRIHEAELMVALFNDLARTELDRSNVDAARARIERSWHAPGRPTSIEAATLRRVCAALRTEKERWTALAVGGSLVRQWRLPWPVQQRAEASRRRRSVRRRRSHTQRKRNT